MNYNVGDRCEIVKNFLSPSNIGDVVTIIDVCKTTKPFYTILFKDGLKGYAVENCLKAIPSIEEMDAYAEQQIAMSLEIM